jgi:hypothetical protein
LGGDRHTAESAGYEEQGRKGTRRQAARPSNMSGVSHHPAPSSDIPRLPRSAGMRIRLFLTAGYRFAAKNLNLPIGRPMLLANRD